MLAQALLDLCLTIIVEWAVVALLLRRWKGSDLLNLTLINLLTNPVGHLAVLSLGMSFWVVEGAVVLVEIALFRLLLVANWPPAILLASAANLASAMLSFVFHV